VKAFLSIVLGLLLLTSLVGISYATPNLNLQPTQPPNNNSCNNQTPNTSNGNYTQNCRGDTYYGNGGRDPHGGCGEVGRIGTDGCTCADGITPHSFEVSDIQADVNCGPP
jgi:hypothetical protein